MKNDYMEEDYIEKPLIKSMYNFSDTNRTQRIDGGGPNG